MPNKKNYFIALVFSFVSGLVNIYGIRHWGLVVTNATGHLSEAVQTLDATLRTSLYYILAYGLGAIWGFSCFHGGTKFKNKWIFALPTLVNLIIFGMAVGLNHVPLVALVFAMSCQNAYGIHMSDGSVRPSQITGIIVNLGEDVAKQLFDNKDKKTEILIKILNIIGFALGGTLAVLVNSKIILLIPIAFYAISSLFLLKRT
jgi:uncharacterized membrane protein YoaK (UPF0700 family)